MKARQGSDSWIRFWRWCRGKACADDDRAGRCLEAAPDVRASVHDDGRVFLCNQTGSRIWQGVVAGLSAEAISEEISRDWGVGCERVRRHTSAFISDLERRGLVIRKVA
jgi:Coenzyme PQQ synthesis protein D (PqqD)